MGEPIRLYNAEGEVVNVYTRSQAAGLLAGGEWYASEADAKASKGDAAVKENVTEAASPAPAKPAPRKGKP